jgi:thioredoxin-related protein
MLRRLPRALFIPDRFAYPILSALTVLVLLLIFANSPDGLTVADLGILVGVMAVLALVWWRFHARQTRNVPINATALLRAIKHSHKPALIAFESEYCPKCMVLGRQLSRLSDMQLSNMTIYHLSVNREPGRALFRQFDGRITPTYTLLDAKGNLIEEWPLILPIDRVIYSVTRQQTT